MLICLDLDGTLEDSRADMAASVSRVRADLKLPPRPEAEVLPHLGKGMDALYHACFDDALSSGVSLARVRAAYEEDYLAHVADATRLYDGMAQALKSLSELGSLAVVTNKPEHISRALLAALGVEALFGTVVGGDTAGVVKPDPLMIRCAAEDVGLKGVPAVMIGDTAADAQMARAFGAKSVWCAWGYTSTPAEADAVAQSPADLPGVVKDLLRLPGMHPAGAQ
jgi:phosphoglycolate phosphatase